MRALVVVLALGVAPSLAAGTGDPEKPLTPEAAAKKIDQKCTVEMLVASVGKSTGVYFLNSKEDYKDKDNFTVFINKEGVASLKDAKIDDPEAHFKSKTVRVTGTVVLYRDRPEIVVDKAEQIKIVAKAGATDKAEKK
jgi:DNA/RNA endonuclease YhcR with UshA esterase domain